jgi:hypothetical protein
MKKLILALSLTGCSFAGTGTGNPHSDYSDTTGGNTKLMQLIDRTCIKISSCHAETTESDCLSKVTEMTEYAAKLGATETPAPSLSQLIWADFNGTRPSDGDAVEACRTQVEALACTDAEVQNAFDANLANPFANSAEMMGPECSRVFSP